MFSKRSLLSTAGLIAVVGTTSWFAIQNTHQSASVQPNQVVADGIAHQVSMKQFDQTGHLSYSGTAEKVTQYSNQNVLMQNIQGTYYPSGDNPSWTGRANQAWVTQGNSVIELKGHVVLTRPASGETQALQLITNQLFLYPKTNTAYTKAPVTLWEPGTQNVTHAVGLSARENPNVIELLSHVQSTYAPPSQARNTLVSVGANS